MTRIGIDLGGSTLRIGVVSVEHEILWRDRILLEDRSPAAIVELVAGAVERATSLAEDRRLKAEDLSLGLGLAAMLRDRAGTVAVSPHLGWRDVPFGDLLRARLPGARIRVDNDVNAIAWGEAIAGAARGCRDALVVYVGTGIGGGVIANGELVLGATLTAGEIGHVKVAWGEGAAPCACGSRGCVEAYVGGSYVQRRIARELDPAMTPADLDARAAAGDSAALAVWEELAPLLALALGNAIALLNPARLVLGGGLLARTPTLVELTIAALELAAPRAALERLVVATAELGDDAGVIGAADLAATS